jgi:hypothetical protein
MILAADFSATGRTVGSFSDLFRFFPADFTVWETVPPKPGDERGMTAADHVGRWLSNLQDRDLHIHAVFGYCVGSVFAARLAENVSEWQEVAPKLVLFDPERPDAGLLRRHYDDAVGVISAMMTPAEVEAARRGGEEAARDNEDLSEVAHALSALVAAVSGPVFARAGLDVARRAELTGTFSSFLSYLAAASEIDPAQAWANAVAISSASPGNGLNVLPRPARNGIVAREIKFDLPHGELLRDKDVAHAVRGLLNESAR